MSQDFNFKKNKKNQTTWKIALINNWKLLRKNRRKGIILNMATTFMTKKENRHNNQR